MVEIMKDNIFWKLLVELKTLFDENGIEYWLGGAILRYTAAISPQNRRHVPEMTDDFGEMEMIVDGNNAKKILKLGRQLPQNRVLESFERNHSFRNLDIYYIDTESTCIDFKCLDRRECLGAFIPIRIITPNYKSGIKQTINIKLEKLWRLCYSYHHFLSSVTPVEEKLYNLYNIVNRSGNGNLMTSIVFKYILSTEFKPSYKTVNINRKNSRIKIRSEHFAKKRIVEINGVKFTTLSDAEGYLKKNYGKNWMNDMFSNPSRYVEEGVSSKEFAKKLYNDETYWKKVSELRMLQQGNRVKNNVYERNWQMAKRVFECIKLEDKLIKKKSLLTRMLEVEDYTGILDIMSDYRKKIIKVSDEYELETDQDLNMIYSKAILELGL